MSDQKDFELRVLHDADDLKLFTSLLLAQLKDAYRCDQLYWLVRDRQVGIKAQLNTERQFSFYSRAVIYSDQSLFPVELLHTMFDTSKQSCFLSSAQVEEAGFAEAKKDSYLNHRFIKICYGGKVQDVIFLANTGCRVNNEAKLIGKLELKIENLRLKNSITSEKQDRENVEADLVEHIRQSDKLLSSMQTLHDTTLALASAESLDELYRKAVELGRSKFALDRVALFLLEADKGVGTGTYGTDPEGKTCDEHSCLTHIHNHPFVKNTLESKEFIGIHLNSPLLFKDQVVGKGWNMMVTLWNDGSPIGWLAIDNLINQQELKTFQKQSLRFYGAAVAQLIVKMRQHEDIRILNQVSLTMAKAGNLLDICKYAVELGQNKLQIDRLALFLVDHASNEMQGTYGTDEEGEVTDETYFRSDIPDSKVIRDALTKKNFFYIKDNVPLYHDKKVVGFGWNGVVSLWNGDIAIGWIAADNLINKRPLTTHQREILRLFANIIAQTIVKKRAEVDLLQLNQDLELRVEERTKALETSNVYLAQANEQLAKLSVTDGLTGIYNRRNFDQLLEQEIERAKRQSSLISLILIDVDYFKQYNDCYGHVQGDNCLKCVASHLKNSVKRSADMVARYGGEEFVVLIPDNNEQEISLLAERLRQGVEGLALCHADSLIDDVVTVSVGYTTLLPDLSVSPECLIEQADKALYMAKEQGRNCIRSYEQVLAHGSASIPAKKLASNL